MTLLLTAYQLYRDYQLDIHQIDVGFEQIESVHLPTISEILWVADIERLETIVDGLYNIRDLNYITVFEANKPLVSKGIKPIAIKGFRSFPLITKHRGTFLEIGVLEVGYDLSAINQRLLDRSFVILTGNFIKTILAVLFMVLIFYRLVTRHLTFISRYLVDLDVSGDNSPLVLNRRSSPKAKLDELDLVVNSINQYLSEIDRHLVERKTTENLLKKNNIEYNQLNQELDQRVSLRTRELEIAVRELEAFTYSISHDLRSPLRSLDGFSLAILEDYSDKLDDTGRDYLNRICRAAARMGELIDDLLHLSRVSKSDLEISPVNLSQLVTDISEDIKTSEATRSFEFIIADGINVDVDPRLLKLALENLLGNSAKYSSYRETSRIEFGETHSKNSSRVFFIRDNGVGFDMKYVEKLFVSFQRLHHQKDYPGNGIGLSIVERVIKKHGGTIWADSVLEEGATFYFQL